MRTEKTCRTVLTISLNIIPISLRHNHERSEKTISNSVARVLKHDEKSLSVFVTMLWIVNKTGRGMSRYHAVFVVCKQNRNSSLQNHRTRRTHGAHGIIVFFSFQILQFASQYSRFASRRPEPFNHASFCRRGQRSQGRLRPRVRGGPGVASRRSLRQGGPAVQGIPREQCRGGLPRQG